MTAIRFFLLGFLSAATVALGALEVPTLRGPVMDEAHLLRRQTVRDLDQLLRTLNAKGVAQVQVLTLSSLGGESIEQASIEVTDKWQLGTAKNDNGVLFLIAAQDKRMRIEVGQGLEGVIPDIVAKRIIEDKVAPHFRRGDFDSGVREGVGAIIHAIDPAFNFVSSETGFRKSSSQRTIVILLFLGFVIFALRRGGRRGFGRSRHYEDWSSGGGWSGGGGWSSGSGSGGWSSGGGWSGGGGGFSGGGASGSW